jgi:hypothetical protein
VIRTPSNPRSEIFEATGMTFNRRTEDALVELIERHCAAAWRRGYDAGLLGLKESLKTETKETRA